MSNKINYLDLFAGVGGFHQGLKKAGFQFNWVGFSEIDKYASSIYKKRFPEAKELGDVRNIESKELPKIDLVTFGFPCTDLSVAGRREGLDGRKSSLFFEAIRLVRDLKPTTFIFENGNLLIQDGYYPKIESEYILSDILEEQVDQKYFLSEKSISYLKKRLKENQEKGRGFAAQLIPDMEH